jgi:3-oxoacyl-[acyl-carrier protein] reductase
VNQSSARPDVSGLLAGKVAVVAGGGRGNGGATAEAFGRAGATVVVIDIEGDRAAKVARDIGPSARSFEADLCSKEQIHQVVDEIVSSVGTFDVWVNNVGGGGIGSVDFTGDDDEDDFDECVAVNVRYMYWACRAASRAMRRADRGGSIINLASIRGVAASPRRVAYGIAKAGVVNMTRTLAVELGPLGIRVNAIAPSFILTEVSAQWARSFDRDLIPLRRLGVPDDVGHAALFFASDLSTYVSGEILVLDGGEAKQRPLDVGRQAVAERLVDRPSDPTQ